MDRVQFALENLRGKILDVGYSVGGIHQKFIESFGEKNVYGVDIETVQDSDHYRRSTAERVPFDSKMFDSVFAGELIEHLEDPRQFLEEANRVLKNDGVIILTTPNKDSLVNRIFHNYETPIHISLFNFPKLRKALEDSGFVVDRFFCQPYSQENAYGSMNKWTFSIRKILHNFLPRELQEEMIVKAVKVT